MIMAPQVLEALILVRTPEHKMIERRLDSSLVTSNFVKNLKKLTGLVNNIKKAFRDVKVHANENMDDLLGVIRQQLPNDSTFKQLNQAENELMDSKGKL